MPEMVRAVIETKEAVGITLAEAFERICRQHKVPDDKRAELQHGVMEFMRMLRSETPVAHLPLTGSDGK